MIDGYLIGAKDTSNDVKRRFHGYLAEDPYVPNDIFDKIAIKSIEQHEFHYIKYTIHWEAHWNAIFGHDRTVTTHTDSLGRPLVATNSSRTDSNLTNIKTETVTDWHPASGVVSGVFSKSYAQGIPYDTPEGFNKNLKKRMDSVSFQNLESVDFSKRWMTLNEKTLIAEISKQLNNKVDSKVRSQGRSADRTKGWNWSITKREIEACRAICPIYKVVYEYNGKSYAFWIDGFRKGVGYFSKGKPQDESLKDRLRWGYYLITLLIILGSAEFLSLNEKHLKADLLLLLKTFIPMGIIGAFVANFVRNSAIKKTAIEYKRVLLKHLDSDPDETPKYIIGKVREFILSGKYLLIAVFLMPLICLCVPAIMYYRIKPQDIVAMPPSHRHQPKVAHRHKPSVYKHVN